MTLYTKVSAFKRIAIITICLLASGCHYTTQHGDAELVHTRGMYRSVAMYLPPVPIGEVGTITFHIRDLPVPMYPHQMQIPDLTKHGRHYGRKRKRITDISNWGDCKVNIQIMTVAGDVIYSSTSKLRDLKTGGTSSGSYEKLNVSEFTTLSLRLYNHNIEPLTSYNMSFTVKTASTRKEDWLRIMCRVPFDPRVQDYRQEWLTPFELGGSSRSGD